MAVGENNINTPILQIKNNKKNGTNLNIIEGMLDIYFWSCFGPHAWKHELNRSIIERMPKVENTCWKYEVVLLRNKYNDESKNGSSPWKLTILKQGVAPEK